MDDESKEQLLSLALVCAVNLAVILLIPVLHTAARGICCQAKGPRT